MTDVTTTTSNVPTHQPNPFEEIGRSSQRPIIGQLLKFSKGDYLAGQDNIPIPMSTRMVVNMDQMLHGWVRWHDNKPAEQVMGLVVEGYVPPERKTLGYLDESEWEVDDRGEPRDPWQPTYYLVMRELNKDDQPVEDGLYTFTTSSRGGSDAVKALCQVYGKWLRFHPDEYPIVMLGYDQYPHSNSAYGMIKTPQFVVGYTSSDQIRAKKKVTLFAPQEKNNWIKKTEFGDIPMTAEAQAAIPF